MQRETKTVELDDGVSVELLAKITARVRLTIAKSVAGRQGSAAATMEAFEQVLPMLIVSVSKNGNPVNAKSLWEWLLDHTESIDPLIMYVTEIIEASNPNAQSGSPNTPEQAAESRQLSGSDTSTAEPTA